MMMSGIGLKKSTGGGRLCGGREGIRLAIQC